MTPNAHSKQLHGAKWMCSSVTTDQLEQEQEEEVLHYGRFL